LDGLKDIEEAMLEKLAAVLKVAQDRLIEASSQANLGALALT
jgi:hypothetical protein